MFGFKQVFPCSISMRMDKALGQDEILAKFFCFVLFCVFMDRDGVEVHQLAKKE